MAAAARLHVQGSSHGIAQVGGTFRMSFTNFTTGNGHSFGGEYLEIVPNERIRYTDRFDDPNLPGVIEVTVTLKPVSCGTEINIEQANLPKMIPVEACYLGWQQSLAQLALVVEPDIPEESVPDGSRRAPGSAARAGRTPTRAAQQPPASSRHCCGAPIVIDAVTKHFPAPEAPLVEPAEQTNCSAT